MERLNLEKAILAKNLDQVKEILIQTPEAIEGNTGDGVPLCFLAAAGGSFPLVRYLVEYSRVSLSVRDQDNRTILHYAAQTDNLDLIVYLVERCGMSPVSGDKNLVTPFDFAVRNQRKEVIQYFETICGCSYANMYQNPIRTGMFPDPSIVRVGEDYYMVNSSFIFFPCIPISHSKDLIHWEIIGHAITEREYAELDELEGGRGYWAPDISWNNGMFYITATYRMNDGGSVCRRQMITKSKTPEGPYSKPVFIHEDGIDPSLFWEEDGSCYMLLNRGARIIPLNKSADQSISEGVLLFYGDQKRAPEGPHLLKKDGWYYLFLAEGGTGINHRITVSRSRHLMGVYQPCPYNPIMTQDDLQAGIQRCGHGKPVMTQNGAWYMVYLCGRMLEGSYTMLGRETALDPITWTADGWPLVNDRKGPSVRQKKPDLPEYRVGACKREYFDAETLGLSWMTPRPPDEHGVSLEGGALCVTGSRAPLSCAAARNMVVRRQTAFEFRAETCLLLEQGSTCCIPKAGQDLGMLCYYDENTWLKFGLFGGDGDELQLKVAEHILEEDRQSHGLSVTLKPNQEGQPRLYLKIETNGLERSFFWKLEEGEPWKLHTTLKRVDYLCDEGISKGKRFTGATVGMYAYAGTECVIGRFLYFDYEDVVSKYL